MSSSAWHAGGASHAGGMGSRSATSAHMHAHARRTHTSETMFDRWMKSARAGLFGVLFTMAKDTASHTKWSIFGMWFDFFQLLLYPLYYGKVFPWYKMAIMKWLLVFLTYLNPNSAADTISPVLKLTLLFVACAWVAATVAAAVWAAYSFSIGNFSTLAPLKFLRATARMTTTALFVPFAALLISAYKCRVGEMWAGTTWQCYGAEHSAIMAMVSLLLPCFWVFTLCVSAVFFDRDYASSNITARAHGRVGISMITIKSGLTLLFTVAADADPWFLHIVVLVSGFLWLWLWLRYLPSYTQWVNSAWSAFGAVFTWAAVCAALAKILNDPQSGVAGYVFYLGVPTAAYAGYALAYMRFHNYARVGNIVMFERQDVEVGVDEAGVGVYMEHTVALPATSAVAMAGGGLKSPFDVELKVRYILRDVIAMRRLRMGHHGHTGAASVYGAHAHGMLAAARRSSTVHAVATDAGDPVKLLPRRSSATLNPDARRSSVVDLNFGGDDADAGGATAPRVGSRASMLGASRRSMSSMSGVAMAPARASRADSFAAPNPLASAVTPHAASMPRAMSRRLSASGAVEGGWVSAMDTPADDGGGAGFIPHTPALPRMRRGAREMELTPEEEAAAIAHAAALFESAKHLFPNSPTLDLFHANFLRCFTEDRDAELAVLNAGLSKEPPMDIRFLLQQSKRQLEEAATSTHTNKFALSAHMGAHAGGGHANGHGKMSIIERVQYEQLMSESIDYSMRARSSELMFWTELRAPLPNLGTLHTLSESMSTSITKATAAFEKLITMRPDGIEVLQSYAVFLLEVKREAAAASRYFDLADELLSAAGALDDEDDSNLLTLSPSMVPSSGTDYAGVVHANESAADAPANSEATSDRRPSLPMLSRATSPSVPGGTTSPAPAGTVAGAIVSALAKSRRANNSTSSLANLRAGTRRSVTPVPGAPQLESTTSTASAAGVHPPLLASGRSTPLLVPTASRMRSTSVSGAAPDPVAPGAPMHAPALRQTSATTSPGAPPLAPTGIVSAASYSRVRGNSVVSLRSSTRRANSSHAFAALPSAMSSQYSMGRSVPRMNSSTISPDGITMDALGSGSATPGAWRASSHTYMGGPSASGGESTKHGMPRKTSHAHGDPGVGSEDGNEALVKGKNRRGSAAVAAYAAAVSRERRASMTGARSLSRGASMARNAKSGQGAPSRTRSSSNAKRKPGSGKGSVNASGKLSDSSTPPSKPPIMRGRAPSRRDEPLPPPARAAVSTSASAGARASGGLPAAKPRPASMAAPTPSHKTPPTPSHKTPPTPSHTAAHDTAGRTRTTEAFAETEEEALMSARERERERTLKRVSSGARLEAHRRRTDAAEAAASSLRLGIRAKATVMEPALVTLGRALTLLCIVAAALMIATAAVQRALVDTYSGYVTAISLSTDRQLTLEAILHDAYALTRLQAGVLPASITTYNVTSLALAASAERLDSLHRQLYLTTAVATPDELVTYGLSSLVVRDINAGPGGSIVETTRIVALSNLGIEFASKVSLLAAVPAANITLTHSVAWFVLNNGPGVVRTAFNGSTTMLTTRLDQHESYIVLLDIGFAIATCGLFGAVSMLLLLPIIARVKAHTDDIFCIFLNLPDAILEDMQTACATQITALKTLADDPDAIALAVQLETKLTNTTARGDDVNLNESADAMALTTARVQTDVSAAELGDTGGTAAPGNACVRARTGSMDEVTGLLLLGNPGAHGPTPAATPYSVSVAEDGPGGSPALAAPVPPTATAVLTSPSRRQVTSPTTRVPGSHLISPRLAGAGSATYFRSDVERQELIREIGEALSGGGNPEDALGSGRGPAATGVASFGGLLSRTGSSFLLGRGDSFTWAGRHRKPIRARDFRATYGMQVRLLARFQWPFLLLALYFLALWGYETATIGSVRVTKAYSVGFGQVRVGLWALDHTLQTIMLDAPKVTTTYNGTLVAGSLPGACNSTALSARIVSMDVQSAVINARQDALLFGDAASGRRAALASDAILSSIMLNDVCSAPGIPSDCASPAGPYRGLLSGGLQASMREFLMGCKQAVQVRQSTLSALTRAAGGVLTCPSGVVTPSADTIIMDALVTRYLDAGFSFVQSLMVERLHAAATSFIIGHAVMTTGSIIALLLLYVFAFLRSLRKMDGDMKRTRGTLLMFPSDVLAGVAEFMDTQAGHGHIGGMGVQPHAEDGFHKVEGSSRRRV